MLNITRVSFPGLGIEEFDINTVAFNMFGIPIAWYALFITFGMVVAVLYVMYRANKINVSVDDIIDFALFVIPIGVIGARAYYVIMEWENYDTFAEMIDIRSGGLAIYGGIIAGAITVFVVCLVKKINFLAFADCVVPGLILAQAIGRWGNFVNGEAFGYETDTFLRMGLTIGGITKYYHPCFLYESLWNILGFIAINFFYKHKKYDGQIFLMIFGWYGLGRLWIEGLRTDSLYLFGTGLRTSQVLAGLILAVCLTALIYFAIKKPNKEFYVREIPAAATAKANSEKKNNSTVDKKSDDNIAVKIKKAINKLWQK